MLIIAVFWKFETQMKMSWHWTETEINVNPIQKKLQYLTPNIFRHVQFHRSRVFLYLLNWQLNLLPRTAPAAAVTGRCQTSCPHSLFRWGPAAAAAAVCRIVFIQFTFRSRPIIFTQGFHYPFIASSGSCHWDWDARPGPEGHGPGPKSFSIGASSSGRWCSEGGEEERESVPEANPSSLGCRSVNQQSFVTFILLSFLVEAAGSTAVEILILMLLQ